MKALKPLIISNGISCSQITLGIAQDIREREGRGKKERVWTSYERIGSDKI
jgi:hypothetical protein